LDTAEARQRADERIAEAEAAAERKRVLGALRRVMERLEPEDRMVVRMHLEDGLTLAAVARALNVEQKPLYRRVDRLRAQLKAWLEGEGVHLSHVHDLRGSQEDP
jgi:RNA polymerase sigma factor for flagellar operon FliA